MDMGFDIQREARAVFDKEILALEKTRDAIDEHYEEILRLIELQGKGRCYRYWQARSYRRQNRRHFGESWYPRVFSSSG